MVRVCLICCMAAGTLLAQGSPVPRRDFSKYLHRPLVKPMKEQLAKAKDWLIAEENRCAHMLTFVPPKDLDSKMAIGPGSKNPGAARTIPPPMEVCAEDIRQLPELRK
jgi:hypothetical protein